MIFLPIGACNQSCSLPIEQPIVSKDSPFVICLGTFSSQLKKKEEIKKPTRLGTSCKYFVAPKKSSQPEQLCGQFRLFTKKG